MNQNHPPKGSIIKVEPIKSWAHIKKIRSLLRNHPRNLAIFNIGINTNLRASDLISLKVGQVRYLKPGDSLILREIKTGKVRTITLNQTCFRTIQELLKYESTIDESYLFRSKKGKGQLSANYLNALVKKWTNQIKIRGNFGSHTLRKTFGYFHRTQLGTDIPTLMRMFNHSTQRQTLEYLCIQPEEIKNAYMKEI